MFTTIRGQMNQYPITVPKSHGMSKGASLTSVEETVKGMPTIHRAYPVLGTIPIRDLRNIRLTPLELLDLYNKLSFVIRLDNVQATALTPDIVHFHGSWRWESVTQDVLGEEEPYLYCAAGSMSRAVPLDTDDSSRHEAVFLSRELRDKIAQSAAFTSASGAISYAEGVACATSACGVHVGKNTVHTTHDTTR
jgi:hypothetical protein